MWRASLFRRIGFLVVVTLATAAVGFIRIGVPPDGGFERSTGQDDLEDIAIRRNLSKHLLARDRLEVPPKDLQVHWDPHSNVQLGHQGKVWFVSVPKAGQATDVYSARFAVSSTGIPFKLSQPLNVTGTPLSNEWIAASDRARVLFCHDQNAPGVRCTLLEFNRPQSLVEGVLDTTIDWLNRHLEYGDLGRPRITRFEVLSPKGLAKAQFKGQLLELVDIDGPMEFRLGKRVVGVTCESSNEPDCLSRESLAKRIIVSKPERGTRDSWERLIDALAQSPLVGLERVVAVRAYAAKSQAWIREKVDRWLEPSEPSITRPRLETAVPETLWPPPTVPALRAETLPGEGEWVPHPIDIGRSNPHSLMTYVRPEKGPAGARVWLYAFDMRRLGFDYVAGTVSPRTMTSNRGQGEVPSARQTDLVAAFNGAPLFADGEAGAKSGGALLVPPVDGLATIAIDDAGTAELGIWDAGATSKHWRSL
ncbi:MAG: hypothetical protein VX589_09200, partial [Myxococcota bacterium]|nr:hypothetical protein [Myxococcota bacterium]